MLLLRKIYRLQGIGGSIYVALPKEWLRRFNLDKGSAVEVSLESDGSLRIAPIREGGEGAGEEKKHLSEIEIFVERPGDVYTSLLTAYLRGFDMITLRFSTSAIEREVKSVIDSAKDLLLGLEAVEIESSYIVLRVLASEDMEMDSMVRNMHKTVRSMYLDALNSLKQNDVELAKAVVLRDRDVNKLYFYLTRTIRRKIQTVSLDPKTLLKLVDMRMLIKFIEEIGDEAKNAASALIEAFSKNLKIDENYATQIEDAVNRVDEIYKNVVMKAHEKSIEISELRQHMKTCLNVRDSMRSLRIKLAEEGRDYYWFLEFIKSFESIAMSVYDILSLMPFEIISTMIYE